MQGKRIYAYVPVGKLDDEGTIVRIGYTNSHKTLGLLFSGLNEPDVVLFEFWAARMKEPREWSNELKSIMRGHTKFGSEMFALFENSTPHLGDNFFVCPYSVDELIQKFEKIGEYFTDFSED